MVDAGGEVAVLGIEEGTAATVNHDLEPAEEVRVEGLVAEAHPDRFDALVVPGGTVGADKLRSDDAAVTFVRRFVGGTWRDAELVRDGNLITSRKPDDLPAFRRPLVEAIAGSVPVGAGGS